MSSHVRLPHCGAEFSSQGAEFSGCRGGVLRLMGPSSPADGAEFSGGRVLHGADFSGGRLLRGADFSGYHLNQCWLIVG